ncbi:Tyrosinase [Orbilia brochopaga]|nr:Tyrosinase [Drechslerella brochopaga]
MAILSVAGRRIASLMGLVLLLCTASVVAWRPPSQNDKFMCGNPKFGQPINVRKEWRTLTSSQQAEFVRAVNCLNCKDAFTPGSVAAGAKQRYDDLVYTHQLQTFSIHYVGHFLPWHRYFTWTIERMMRDECDFKGVFPYWAWEKDLDASLPEQQKIDKYLNSPIWNTFGHNGALIPTTPGQEGMAPPGRMGGGCTPDGAFKNMVINLGPGAATAYNPRCLSRDLAPYFAAWYLSKNSTQHTMQAQNFTAFDDVVEGGPGFGISGIHGGGHYGIGGTYGIMGDLYLSPGDPSFWLHHSNLDRVWHSWQKCNWNARKLDMGGPSQLMNKSSPPVTLAQPIAMGKWAMKVNEDAGMTVKDVMDINAMCYDYDSYYDCNTADNVPPFSH